ncbi:hypothetical protein RZQ47_01420 [Klebsiella variicola subsp. variicola]|nr:hypothetical protein [Klebsiella variicola]MDV1440383.1 hypothetical protein [Klebsiella variicola subsp. variicola]GKI83753.1 hypothetical protein NUKP18_18130 [Klebsiella variicola]
MAAKDEFLNIKNVSRGDLMAAHCVPPQMMGIMPSIVGGGMWRRRLMFLSKMKYFRAEEISRIKSMAGEGIIRFGQYKLN